MHSRSGLLQSGRRSHTRYSPPSPSDGAYSMPCPAWSGLCASDVAEGTARSDSWLFVLSAALDHLELLNACGLPLPARSFPCLFLVICTPVFSTPCHSFTTVFIVMSSAYQAGAAAYQHLRTEDGLDEDLPLEERCEDDRCKASTSTVWHCVDCDSNYCSDCWGYQGPHKAGKLGRDGVPHERTDVKVVSRLKKVLQPSESADAIRKAHEIDQSTKWFGTRTDESSCGVRTI